MSLVLEVRNLDKRYGATHALTDVSFTVSRGSVHAIIGENGAGKSTFIKSLSGLETPDAGAIILEGKEFRPRNLSDSRRAGVATAFQELGLLANLTVAENLLLPQLGGGRSPFVGRKANERAAKVTLAQFGLDYISPSQEVGMLSLAERQKLEIARAISHGPRLLLLDEPTSALPDPEWLYGILETVKMESPDLTVLYISHRLNEIRDLCESATVLRNGEVVDTVSMKDVDDAAVFSLMAGAHGTRILDAAESRRAGSEQGAPTITVSGLCGEKIEDVSFTLHEGEILGVAGLQGQGQREVFRMLAGVQRPSAGTIEVEGKAAKLTSPSKALRHGISFVPEERKTEGLLPGLSALANVSIASLRKFTVLGFIVGKREYVASLAPSSIIDLSPEYLRKDVDALSGGNQQKAVLARSLMKGAKRLLLYDPSRGVDVGTKGSLYDMMRRVTEEGTAILWYSTDLQELTSVSDRIIAFYKGTVVAEMDGGQATVEGLMRIITGQHTASGTGGR